ISLTVEVIAFRQAVPVPVQPLPLTAGVGTVLLLPPPAVPVVDPVAGVGGRRGQGGQRQPCRQYLPNLHKHSPYAAASLFYPIIPRRGANETCAAPYTFLKSCDKFCLWLYKVIHMGKIKYLFYFSGQKKYNVRG